MCAFFDNYAVFDNDNVHRATSIHSRIDISGMFDKLSDDAVIYVKNKNEFESLVGMADSIPAAYKSKIKFVSDNVAQDDGTVKHSDRDDYSTLTSKPDMTVIWTRFSSIPIMWKFI